MITYLEILASKICHDLLSPVGAMVSGVEFITEMGGDIHEAMDLLAMASAATSAKLQIFRMAYGAGGATASMVEAHAALERVLVLDNKITQNWNPQDISLDGKGAGKIVLLALMLARECLPYGGALVARQEDTDVIAEACGENVVLHSSMIKALTLCIPPEDIPLEAVHGAFTALFARKYGFSVAVQEQERNRLILRVSRKVMI